MISRISFAEVLFSFQFERHIQRNNELIYQVYTIQCEPIYELPFRRTEGSCKRDAMRRFVIRRYSAITSKDKV